MISDSEIKFVREHIKGKLRIEAIKILKEMDFSNYDIAVILKEV